MPKRAGDSLGCLPLDQAPAAGPGQLEVDGDSVMWPQSCRHNRLSRILPIGAIAMT